jgi:hypothetical protein
MTLVDPSAPLRPRCDLLIAATEPVIDAQSLLLAWGKDAVSDIHALQDVGVFDVAIAPRKRNVFVNVHSAASACFAAHAGRPSVVMSVVNDGQ